MSVKAIEILDAITAMRVRGIDPHTIEINERDVAQIVEPYFPYSSGGSVGKGGTLYGLKVTTRPAFVIHGTPRAAKDEKKEVF